MGKHLLLRDVDKKAMDLFYDHQNDLRKAKGRPVSQTQTFCAIVKEFHELKKQKENQK